MKTTNNVRVKIGDVYSSPQDKDGSQYVLQFITRDLTQ